VARAARARGERAVLLTPAIHSGQLGEAYRRSEAVTALMREFELFLWEGAPVLTHFYGNARRQRGNVAIALHRWQHLAAAATREVAENRR
jgi:hypothetical protein